MDEDVDMGSSEDQEQQHGQHHKMDLEYGQTSAAIKPKVKVGAACVPGQKICVANEYFEAGDGAYEFGNTIFASVLGYLHIQEFPEQELSVVSVKRKDDHPPFTAPYVGAIVTCVVLSRTPKLARCLITHVGKVKLSDMVKGIIRREYISEKHRDLAEIETSFGIGDVVLARVVGIGDGDFIMSTGEDNLGVAQAISKAGYYMVPIGWTKMECPLTKEVQLKKVAKIVQHRNMDYWRRRNEEIRMKDKGSDELSKRLKKECND